LALGLAVSYYVICCVAVGFASQWVLFPFLKPGGAHHFPSIFLTLACLLALALPARQLLKLKRQAASQGQI
jgi:hypothetical protein